MKGYTLILWGSLALLVLYLLFTLWGREHFTSTPPPKNMSIWQDGSGAWTGYWEPPDTNNAYSFSILGSDNSTYTIPQSTSPFQTYSFGNKPIGFAAAISANLNGVPSGSLNFNTVSKQQGDALVRAKGGSGSSQNVVIPTLTAPSTSTTTTLAASQQAQAPPTQQVQQANVAIPTLSGRTAPGRSALLSGIAGLLLTPTASKIVTTGQVPIGDVGQETQIYEYNNGYAAFAVSANLFGDTVDKIKTDMSLSENEYNVSVISDNGVIFTYPLDQITTITSSQNGEVVGYNFVNASFPKGNNYFTGTSAKTLGMEITLVTPSDTGNGINAEVDQSPLTSSISTPNPLAAGVGSTLNAPANAPTYGPAGIGGGCAGPNGTIPPLAPNTSSTQPGAGCASNTVPKSSLVPCSCATSGSASCSTHQGSTCGSTVPGQPGSSCSDPADTISSLTKAQRQWDLMKPFNSIMGDVPGYLNSFSAFG